MGQVYIPFTQYDAILDNLGPLAGLLSLGFEARIPTAVLSKYQVEHVTHRSYMKPESLYQKQCRLHGFIRISNTVRTGSFTSRVITLAFPVAVESAFAFPVAISFLFCNFLHNRQGFSANFGPIILVPIFFCPDFPSFQSFSPLKCAWWDCFRTRVTATLLADRVVRSGCEPLLA